VEETVVVAVTEETEVVVDATVMVGMDAVVDALAVTVTAVTVDVEAIHKTKQILYQFVI